MEKLFAFPHTDLLANAAQSFWRYAKEGRHHVLRHPLGNTWAGDNKIAVFFFSRFA
jgi:hypothetical protein